jgi:SAM-dependent methyltransferase
MRRLIGLTGRILVFFAPKYYKHRHELRYWKQRFSEAHGALKNEHYEFFYTTFFGISPDHYRGKRVLDIGCGPRGSLEWLHDADECVGLDPLADEYRELGAKYHRMKYVKGVSEEIPFPDEYFDIVTSFNSLDHVDNLEQTLKEIARVCKPGAIFLLITEFGHEATACEPQEFGLEVMEKISRDFRVENKRLFGVPDNHEMYGSLRNEIPYVSGSGFASAKFIKQTP